MNIKLTDQGKKRIASVLSSTLTEAQHYIDNYIKDHVAEDPTWPDIDFKDPTCHLIAREFNIQNGFQVADSLSGVFSVDFDEHTLLLWPCLVYPISPGTLSRGTATGAAIAAHQYGRLLPDVLNPGIRECLELLGISTANSYHCGYFDDDGFVRLFNDAGFSCTQKTHLFIAFSVSFSLASSEYTLYT